ncbi:MAG: bifunctional 4-hydroxy-2-oxoglutarate aldolase/2-dehydro-3-deoxy-phosphogluconate aldolase [Omnitrophica bacterium]|nr:bifunctional 4-hydroxy-2-oxoglutarate aldolase/2-dehydro-3-deoxy-phosphogluconate aldolase [Candidatus Omnitrophota bacterium]
MDIGKFRQLPLIGILRGIEKDVVKPLIGAVISAGLQTIEITMNTPAAPKLIQDAIKSAQGKLTIGAGTVLTRDDLGKALDSGATFIVLPTLVTEVVEYCVKKSIPVFAGALTPQEIYKAWSMGATMVKVFPAKFFGPEYFKEIKGPFGQIELLACGGITADNIQDFFSCGASAVAFGGSIFRKEWLALREFSRIEEDIKALIAGFRG